MIKTGKALGRRVSWGQGPILHTYERECLPHHCKNVQRHE
jgi:hypothetical protein